jgi:glycosyltransferase involved in cell wall biosynthesis
VRLLDRIAPPPDAESPLVAELTALVKTFERPQVLRRLVGSIKRLYPGLRIVVVDDSRVPTTVEGVQTIEMPYDSGISAGRNEGLRHVATKYVLLLDDDVVLFRRTGLGPALALLERHREIDIMGGQLLELPSFGPRPPAHLTGTVFATNATPRLPIGTAIGGLSVCTKVSNFFIARRDRLALVPWDPELKRMEHADFFTRALGVLVTVFNPELKCLHARTPFDADYMAKRLDVSASRAILADRYPRER